MSEKAILYDQSKCTACRGCQAACKQWNDRRGVKTVNTGSYENPPELSAETWLKMEFLEVPRSGNGGVAWLFNRRSCMHCTNAGCVAVCPSGALYHHELGFVAYNENLCTGCGYCVEACPYKVPHLNGGNMSTGRKIGKCTFCQDRVSNGFEPACVKACPPGALAFGDRGQMLAKAEERLLEVKAMRDPVTDAPLWPRANIYGAGQLEGLHVLYLLTDDVGNFKSLPANAHVSGDVTAWQSYLQPVGYAVVGLVVAGLGMNYMVARARMIRDKEGK